MKTISNTFKSKYNDDQFSLPKIILIIVLIMQSDGLVSSIIGFDRVHGGWLYSALMILFFGISISKLFIIKKGRESRYFYYPTIVFFTVFTISAISNSFIFPKPASDWIPSLYVFLPIFIFYAFYALNTSEKEISAAFISITVIVTILLLIDKATPIYFMNEYIRASSFFDGSRRIVLLKNEFVFGAIIIASLMLTQKSEKHSLLTMTFFGFIFVTQIIFMESRLAFSAIIVSLIALFHINGLTKKTSRILLIATISAAILLPAILYEYAKKLGQMSLGDDSSNISIRLESIQHLLDIYILSNGWGVGMMSPTGTINNILASDPRYNIADTGAFSALGQFGLPGLLLWIILTYQCIIGYRSKFILSAKKNHLSAAGYSFLIGFTASVLPLSFFFQSWNISMGGLLLYLLWLCKTKSPHKKTHLIQANKYEKPLTAP